MIFHNFKKQIFHLLWICLIFVSSGLSAAQSLPDISPNDVKKKLFEIMQAHATYKKMTPELAARALLNFINEMDPAKTYFIESDISGWLAPSPELLDQVVKEYDQATYTTFEAMFDKMKGAIHRRDEMEDRIDKMELPKDVDIKEFKEMEWAKDEEALFQRLYRLKALQLEIAGKIDEKSRDLALQRLTKQRYKREQEFLTNNAVNREHFFLSLILKATASALDSQTAYFTPAEAEQFLIQVQQRMFGLGVLIRDDLTGYKIMKIVEGGPADLDGRLKAEDQIVAINGEPVVGMDINDVVDRIRGEAGTEVILTILRSQEEGKASEVQTIEITLKRGEVVLKENRIETSHEPYGDGVIGHIKLFSFYQDPQSSSSSDLAKAIDELKKLSLKGLVLDLRDNTGGVLLQAVSVSGLFITKGVVVSVKESGGEIQRLREIDGKVNWDGPLIILTNRLSASAAEIVAQTLQEYGRAIVVGDDHTFGKGTFQTFTLNAVGEEKVNPKGEYKVTRGKYYTVSGKTPQLVGVIPDIEIPGPYSNLDIGEKFTKYPLYNDEIKPQFDDDLSDIPFFQRERVGLLYKAGLQQRLTAYSTLLPLLKSNAEYRMKHNKEYQKFLEAIKKESPDPEVLKLYVDVDFQYIESAQIMKDLLYLLKK